MTISVVQTGPGGTFSSGVTSGNWLILVGGTYSFGTTTIPVSPTLGGNSITASATVLESATSGGSGGGAAYAVWLYQIQGGDAGATVAGCSNGAGDAGSPGVIAYELSGSSLTLDQFVSQTGSNPSAFTLGPTGATAHASEIAIAAVSAYTQTPVTSDVSWTTATGGDTMAGYKAVATSGTTVSMTGVDPGSYHSYAGCIVTLYESGGGGSSVSGAVATATAAAIAGSVSGGAVSVAGPVATAAAAALAGTVQAGGLYAAYACNEGSGTTILDYSGNGRDMTISGSGNSWVTGEGAYANAFLAGASAGGASWNNGSADPVLGSDVTVMCWAQTVNGSTTQSFAAGIFSAANTARMSMYSYRSLSGTAASPQATVRNSSGTVFSVGSNGTTADSSWHHVAAVYHSAGTVDLYLDGTAVVTGSSVTSGIGTTVQYLGVGSSIAGAGGQSAVQDFRVFSSALTSAQVTTYMDTPVVSSGTSVAGAASAAAAAALAGTVQAGAVISGAVAPAAAAAPAGTVKAGAAVTGALGTAAASAPAGSVTAGAVIAGPVATAAAAALAGAAGSGGSVVSGMTAAAVAAALAGTVHAGAAVTGAVAAAAASGPAGTVSAGAVVAGPVATAAAGAFAGSVTIGAGVAGLTATAQAQALAGLIHAGATVAGPVAVATAFAPAGSVPGAAGTYGLAMIGIV